jgi:zinc transporter, ZIP family
MSVVAALAWGGFSSASLYIGEALAGPMARANRLTGMVMGFGAGTMLSAVAYELIPDSTLGDGETVGAGCLLGALVYFGGDWLVDRGGGSERQRIATTTTADAGDGEGSGAAMFLGALLDGVPEAFILGITLALGGTVSLAFVVAVFVSNIPQGIAGTTSLKAAGYTDRKVFGMWTGLTVAAAAAAGLGFGLADNIPAEGALFASAFAAGAVLVMLADSMMPEAFEHGGRLVGLMTVLGFLVAAALAVLD